MPVAGSHSRHRLLPDGPVSDALGVVAQHLLKPQCSNQKQRHRFCQYVAKDLLGLVGIRSSL